MLYAGGMTHEEIRAALLGAVDGTLDPQELDEVEAHVAACADCRLEQVELYRMRRSLDREDRAREAEAPSPRRFGPVGLGGWVRLALLAAAVGVFAFTFGRARAKAPAPPPPPVEEDEGGVFPVTLHPAP